VSRRRLEPGNRQLHPRTGVPVQPYTWNGDPATPETVGEFWLPPAERPPRPSEWLADWPCHHAERTERVSLRPYATREISWADWHMDKYERTGDPVELARVARHRPLESRIDIKPAPTG
jgi:hypothetical protein